MPELGAGAVQVVARSSSKPLWIVVEPLAGDKAPCAITIVIRDATVRYICNAARQRLEARLIPTCIETLSVNNGAVRIINQLPRRPWGNALNTEIADTGAEYLPGVNEIVHAR